MDEVKAMAWQSLVMERMAACLIATGHKVNNSTYGSHWSWSEKQHIWQMFEV